MKTGLIGAMHEEILLLRDEIEDLKLEEFGSREFYSGTIDGNEVVLALSGWGKVAAASTATSLLNRYNVDRIVFIGLSGSLHPNLNIGDIVVGDKLVQHDVDLSYLVDFPDVKPPFWKEFHFTMSQEAVQHSLEAVEKFIENHKERKYPKIGSEYNPQVYVGPIGTGDQFVASSEGKDRISSRYPEILCTEMEGAAIAQVAADYDVPCAVIRIISDKADDNAHESFVKFLFENISHISVEIAKLLFR